MESTFRANPGVDTLYDFGDGNAFVSKARALEHGRIVKKEFKVIERKDYESEVKEVKKEEIILEVPKVKENKSKK